METLFWGSADHNVDIFAGLGGMAGGGVAGFMMYWCVCVGNCTCKKCVHAFTNNEHE